MRSLEQGSPDAVLHGRTVVGGRAEGLALVTYQSVPGWGGIDPMSGIIIEKRHELFGVSVKDRVLVFPGAKGSSGWSAAFHTARLAGCAPSALLFNRVDTKVALGAVVMRAPAITEFDVDPLSIIRTGDWIVVDGNNSIVEIYRTL